jgi:ParB/RepB/Spo0J family partition protein
MSTTAVATGELRVRLDRLFVPENVREINEDFITQLERSVQARGKLIDPVEVIDADHAVHGDGYDYVLVAGFHRAEVARRLGHETIPGIYGDPKEEHTDRAVENIVRRGLNPYEEAIAIKRILDEGKSEEQAADLLGMSRHLVTRRVKLLELPDSAQRLIGEGTLVLASVEPMRTIAQASPALLDAVIEFIAEHGGEVAPDDLVHEPLTVLLEAVEAGERDDVFAMPLNEVPLRNPDLLPQDETTTALLAEARELHKQANPHSYLEPRIRFTEAETDRARAAGVLLEHGEECPLVTDPAFYQDLCRTAIAAGVESLKQQATQRAEEESVLGPLSQRRKPEDEHAALEIAHRRKIRQLAATAHSANLDLGNSLRNGLAAVDPTDMTVARFFVYALLGQDTSGYGRDTVVSAIARRGIRLVISDFREDKTKKRKDGSPGALRISYGDGITHENQSHWLWKYLDGARHAGELYGRALVVIAAEQYASRLVVPGSQQTEPLSWPSNKDVAIKALKQLAGPHIAPTLKALEKAIARAEREHREAQKALREARLHAEATPTTVSELNSEGQCRADEGDDRDPLDPHLGAPDDEHPERLDTGDATVAKATPQIPLVPPVASNVEQPNEEPDPLVDLATHSATGTEGVKDASEEIDF